MKKQFFRILSCCVLLACLCALPAYAQEPKAAQPASKEDKVVTDVTGSADLMRNVVGFTTQLWRAVPLCAGRPQVPCAGLR